MSMFDFEHAQIEQQTEDTRDRTDDLHKYILSPF